MLGRVVGRTVRTQTGNGVKASKNSLMWCQRYASGHGLPFHRSPATGGGPATCQLHLESPNAAQPAELLQDAELQICTEQDWPCAPSRDFSNVYVHSPSHIHQSPQRAGASWNQPSGGRGFLPLLVTGCLSSFPWPSPGPHVLTWARLPRLPIPDSSIIPELCALGLRPTFSYHN